MQSEILVLQEDFLGVGEPFASLLEVDLREGVHECELELPDVDVDVRRVFFQVVSILAFRVHLGAVGGREACDLVVQVRELQHRENLENSLILQVLEKRISRSGAVKKIHLVLVKLKLF